MNRLHSDGAIVAAVSVYDSGRNLVRTSGFVGVKRLDGLDFADVQRNVVHNRFWDWPLIENTLQLFLFAENTEIKKLLKVSAIYSGESAVVRALPVAIETLAGMVRDFELLFSTDHRRLGLFLN